VPAYTDAGDVFAMPCRTRLLGLEPEAFGIVFLEAQACGLPVLVGDSGGAPETLLDSRTGFIVDPADGLAPSLSTLLREEALRQALGVQGVEWARDHTWGVSALRLREFLTESAR
jgi:phosphatidylinositol alpha-1,6-mannosyltransferase